MKLNLKRFRPVKMAVMVEGAKPAAWALLSTSTTSYHNQGLGAQLLTYQNVPLVEPTALAAHKASVSPADFPPKNGQACKHQAELALDHRDGAQAHDLPADARGMAGLNHLVHVLVALRCLLCRQILGGHAHADAAPSQRAQHLLHGSGRGRCRGGQGGFAGG